jgi:cytochrome c oxidase subunit 2
VKLPAVLVLSISTAALLLLGLWVGYNVNVLPIAASSNAPTYDALFKVLFSIGTVLFLGILILLVYSLVAFRRRPGDVGDGLAIEGNLPLEIVWTAIPAVVAYNRFATEVDRLSIRFETFMEEFSNILHRQA